MRVKESTLIYNLRLLSAYLDVPLVLHANALGDRYGTRYAIYECGPSGTFGAKYGHTVCGSGNFNNCLQMALTAAENMAKLLPNEARDALNARLQAVHYAPDGQNPQSWSWVPSPRHRTAKNEVGPLPPVSHVYTPEV